VFLTGTRKSTLNKILEAEMVDIDLRKLSAPVEALRPALSEAYRRLDAKWAEISDTLKSLPIPTEVSHTFCSEVDLHRLVWKKWNGKKRICIEVHSFNPDNGDPYSDFDVTTTPYEEWSGQQRIEMLEHVPGLFDAAVKATQIFIAKAMNQEV
jgi:hypothetical protein